MKKTILSLAFIFSLFYCSTSEVKEQAAPIDENVKTPEEIIKEKQAEDAKKGVEKLPAKKN
jgi:hypothetical protein